MKSHRAGPPASLKAGVVPLPRRAALSHPSASSEGSRPAGAEWGRYRFKDNGSCSPTQESHPGATCSAQGRRPRLQGQGAMSRTRVQAVLCGPGSRLRGLPCPASSHHEWLLSWAALARTDFPARSPTGSEAALFPRVLCISLLSPVTDFAPFSRPEGASVS